MRHTQDGENPLDEPGRCPDPSSLALGGQVRGQEIEIGFSGARGEGPTSSIALGLDIMVGIPWASIVGEASTWRTWGVDCIQTIPDSYRCSTGGSAFFEGIRVVPPQEWPVRPYLEGKVGKFGPSPIPRGRHRPTTQSVEVGARFQLPGFLSLELGRRKVCVGDQDSEEVFDEEIGYSMLIVRLLAKVR